MSVATAQTHDPEIERALLGSVLINPDCLEDIRQVVDARHFHLEQHKWIFRAMEKIAARGDQIDNLTLSRELADHHKLEQAGGDAYITGLLTSTPTSVNALTYARTVARDAARRRAFGLASDVAKIAGEENGADPAAMFKDIGALVEHEARGFPQPKTNGLKLLTADEILTTEWPEPEWAVPGLLPAGLTILAGKPKVGKSWLALQVAQAVAAGGVALGEHVERRPILYLALEDSPQRLKRRMAAQGWPTGTKASFMTLGDFIESVGDLRKGGGDRLAETMRLDHFGLVVLDTLSRATSGDQNDVSDMTRALEPLQEIAHEMQAAVIMVDHHRKGGLTNPDAIADILGSTGKGAVADAAWGLYRERGKAGATLQVVGRDLEERTLAVTFDVQTGSWQLEGDVDAINLTDRRQAILDAVDGMGPCSFSDILEAVGGSRGRAFEDLQELVGAGLVVRRGHRKNTTYSPREEELPEQAELPELPELGEQTE